MDGTFVWKAVVLELGCVCPEGHTKAFIDTNISVNGPCLFQLFPESEPVTFCCKNDKLAIMMFPKGVAEDREFQTRRTWLLVALRAYVTESSYGAKVAELQPLRAEGSTSLQRFLD